MSQVRILPGAQHIKQLTWGFPPQVSPPLGLAILIRGRLRERKDFFVESFGGGMLARSTSSARHPRHSLTQVDDALDGPGQDGFRRRVG
ncbi:hypothetical protein C6376_12535 [Streptomyces sp. P3]|nr:hypothetical protein C6376_12535 [Streptomyces sp. P3]